MINEKAAREYAASKGLIVGKRVVTVDGLGKVQTVQVGTLTITHDGRGGSGCWKLPGAKCGDTIGVAIQRAVDAQVAS